MDEFLWAPPQGPSYALPPPQTRVAPLDPWLTSGGVGSPWGTTEPVRSPALVAWARTRGGGRLASLSAWVLGLGVAGAIVLIGLVVS